MAIKAAGQLIQDGTVTWIIDDVRDGARVGDIILRPTLRDGFIKANGATVKASDYLRLLAWVQKSNMTVTAEKYAQDCSKYVYDAAQDKLTLPNAVGRVLQSWESVKSVDAGLPNITGDIYSKGPNIGRECGVSPGSGTGAFAVDGKEVHSPMSNAGVESHAGRKIKFDASQSNPIYGRSETVQPPALAMIAQIKY